ncbi:Flp family type IVb pilin [Lysinibacillus antri]|uniref:Flp family type IVb pilin n=1 Tax=Lysinibacillus antri TaxID=2498145 RepID=A0A3S0PN28_9BACI|nr:Flp family type IVb pilin [Lysinibacillus antri]RUL49576.1 Flp family type IVb pilin [Lysinibacillus antri]
MEQLKRLVMEEEGATMVEYGLIVALIAVVAMVGAKTLGTAVHTLFNGLAGDIKK